MIQDLLETFRLVTVQSFSANFLLYKGQCYTEFTRIIILSK